MHDTSALWGLSESHSAAVSYGMRTSSAGGMARAVEADITSFQKAPEKNATIGPLITSSVVGPILL